MDSQDETPGPSSVPALIDDYHAHEDAYRAQARELARLREEVFATAGREAGDIVNAARSEVRRIVLKARRDLLMLAAQVEVVGNMPASGEHTAVATSADGGELPAGSGALVAARQDLRGVLQEASSEFEAVALNAHALQSQVAQWQDAPTSPPSSPLISTLQLDASMVGEPVAPRRRIFNARALGVAVIAFAVVGAAILIGSRWWLTHATARATAAPVAIIEPAPRPSAEPQPAAPVETPVAPDNTTPPPPSVDIELRRPAWLRLTQDGRVAAARLFQAGETLRITDAREVSIRAGDAGAVVVSVNGGESSPLGRDGQVVTRSFVLAEPETGPTSATPAVAPPADAGSTRVEQGRGTESAIAPNASVAPPPTSEPQLPRPEPSAVPQQPPPAVVAAPARPPVAEPAVVPAPEPPARTPAPASLEQANVASAAARWLDAYYRQDRSAMAALSAPQLILSDERSPTERLPPGAPTVRRTVDDVSVRIFGNDAMYVAKMTERTDNGSPATASVAFVSQMWTMRDGALRLTNVRIVSAAALNRNVR